MGALVAYIDPRVLDSMDPRLRKNVEDHFARGVRQVDVQLARREFKIAEASLEDIKGIVDVEAILKQK